MSTTIAVRDDGAAAGYRAGRTLSLAAEWRRQAARRRTPLALGFMVLLPFIVLGAVGGAVLLVILSSILDQIQALGGLRNLLPTHYNDAWLGLLSTPVQADGI